MRYTNVRKLGMAMNEMVKAKANIRLVHSNPYSWCELTLLKLNKAASTRISKQNPAGLKLVD